MPPAQHSAFICYFTMHFARKINHFHCFF